MSLILILISFLSIVWALWLLSATTTCVKELRRLNRNMEDRNQ